MDRRAFTLMLASLTAQGRTGLAVPARIAWQPAVELATGRGERGPWQQNDSRYDFVDDPSVSIDEQGEIGVAWVDQKRKAVLFQRLSADARPLLARPTDVSRQPDTFSWLPRVVLAPARQAFVVWQEIIFSGGSHGGDIFFARSLEGGRSFEPPVNLSHSVAGDGKGRLTRDIWDNGSFDLAAGSRGVYVVWTEYEGALWFRRSTDEGRRFEPPKRVGEDVGLPARAPSLALARDGTVFLAWTVGEDPAADLRLVVSNDAGASFTAAAPIARSAAHSDAPKIAVDAAGVLHLAFAEGPEPLGLHRVLYSRSRDGGREFEATRDISDPLPRGYAGAAFPHLALDGWGHVCVVFELFTSARQGPRGLGICVSSDGGRRFTAPAVLAHSVDTSGGYNGSSQGLLMKKLAVNGDGRIAIVNSSLKPGSHSRVWLMRGSL